MHGNRAARPLLSALLLLALLAIPSPAAAEPIAELINQHRMEMDLLHLPIDRMVLEALPVFDVATGKLRLRVSGESCDNDSGSFLILHLWATWCAPCKAELALWKRLAARLGRQLDKDYPGQYGEMRIVHVAMQKDVSSLGAFLKEMEDRMPPGPVFVDRDGRLAAQLREVLKQEARLPLTLWRGLGGACGRRSSGLSAIA